MLNTTTITPEMQATATLNTYRTPARITRDYIIDLFQANKALEAKAQSISLELAMSLDTLRTCRTALKDSPIGGVLAGVIRNLEATEGSTTDLLASLTMEGFGGES